MTKKPRPEKPAEVTKDELAEFLKRGGKVVKCPRGESGYDSSWNKQPKWKVKT